MINRFWAKFSLRHEKEEAGIIIENIDKGVVFRGTNLWVLIFAIFIASLGLNVNSTAVIIGAMLISPLMGPIMGLGLAVGINDLSLLRKSFYNYSIAAGAALATSTFFFLLSPLNEAHSEILARTSPNIYDVLIALFGGFAGMIATASRQKGNVIPGVAIATALMPPLCTAGYGLSTLKFDFFIGAFYLFIINTVFIAFATFITTRLLKFPYTRLPDKKADRKAHRVIWLVVVVTIVPSIYFGYDIVQQDKFIKKANHFIDTECKFQNDYLLNRKIDAKRKLITLVYGGAEIDSLAVKNVKSRLTNAGLGNAILDIHQGFAYLEKTTQSSADNEQAEQFKMLINAKDTELQTLRNRLDSTGTGNSLAKQVYDELTTQFADLNDATIGQAQLIKSDSTSAQIVLVTLNFSLKKSPSEKKQIGNWLRVRFQKKDIKVIFQ